MVSGLFYVELFQPRTGEITVTVRVALKMLNMS